MIPNHAGFFFLSRLNFQANMSDFVHLDNHSHYSLLDSSCKIKDLVNAAVENRMTAFALTDYGNLFGVAEFFKTARNAGIQPIVGMEAYVTSDRMAKDKIMYHLVLIAQNNEGYRNLMKLSSEGWLNGFYYKPRIDKALLRKHAAGLIGLSACLKGEIATKYLTRQDEAAEQSALEYREIFDGRFYIEIQNHDLQIEKLINPKLIALSRKTGIPLVAANDIKYIRREHAQAHDILMCIQSGKSYGNPRRPQYPGDTFYFRSAGEMISLFKDTPEAIENTVAIAEQCTVNLEFGKVLLPDFPLPAGHDSMDGYLRHLSEQGLARKYEVITDSMRERLNYELKTISDMGFPGYFLIVQDFINTARKMGVSVGLGRGSAAGSLVSYATGITNIDPLKYNLLFERFLNPERVSMPDIDIDFADRGRGKVIDYVIEKYGKENVSQIITFGSMAARGILRDVGRALDIPLPEVDRIAKLVPRRVGVTLEAALKEVPEFREIEKGSDKRLKNLLEFSQVLEGLVRQPGIHAAGIVITPEPIADLVPIYKTGKDEVTTQFDKDWVEKIGLLKMDFLGLTTLTILDDALDHIEKAHDRRVDLEKIPLDDAKTFALFSEGHTIGVFQFESQGMTEYMKRLKPTNIEDLIAMNALYRPGPMEFINNFINRKHGIEKVDCYHANLEPILKSTYGVIVYQEQVMQIAQVLAGFSLGKADVVRRMMAKKKPEDLEKIKPEWIEGTVSRGYDRALAEKIFELLVPFSNYAFNKSHSAAYAVLAYHTAYLKANYPAEFMTAVLTSEMGDSDRVVKIIEECGRMELKILPPDINESDAEFTVRGNTIRFGLGAVKNVGLSAIDSILRARQENGRFTNLFELCRLVDLRLCNKKTLESLVYAGAMDSLDGNRAQIFALIDGATAHGNKHKEQENLDQISIFGEDSEEPFDYVPPALPDVPPWSQIDCLQKEKEILGFYVSGNPLEDFRSEIELFSNYRPNGRTIREGTELRVAGMITACREIITRRGSKMAFATIQTLSGSVESILFAETYDRFKDLIKDDTLVMVRGKASQRDTSETKIIADEIKPIDQIREQAKRIRISIDATQLNDTLLQQILDIVQSSESGQCELELALLVPGIKVRATYSSKKFYIKPGADLFKRLVTTVGRKNLHVDM